MPTFYSLPSLAFTAMLRYTGAVLDPISCPKVQMFSNRMVRGGICVLNNKFQKANNKYLKDFEETPQENQLQIHYMDVNSLYSQSMTFKLPISDFHFLDKEEVENFDPLSIDLEGMYGFILEVDIIYEDSLREAHNKFPFFPVKQIVPNTNQEKLLLTVENKEKYVDHLRNLVQGIKHGLICKKIHKILKFKQSDWIAKFVRFTLQKRAEATSPFLINLSKLILNSVFGKFLENSFKRRETKIICDWSDHSLKKKDLRHYVSYPNFKDFLIINETTVLVEMRKLEKRFFKNTSIGSSILDISKYIVYNIYYDIFPTLWKPENMSLLYCDTDSYVISVHGVDMYEIIRTNPQYFDTSNIPSSNRFNIVNQNKKVSGLLKMETGAEVVKAFARDAPKSYCVLLDDDSLIKRLKGIDKNSDKKFATFEDYRDGVLQNKIKYFSSFRIRSINLKLFIRYETKRGIANQDNKRVWISPSESYAYGNPIIKKLKLN